MKFSKGTWVKIHRRRLDGPDLTLIGKVIEATRDYAVAEARTPSGPQRFTLSEDTAALVTFSRMTQADWQRLRRH